MTTNVQSVVTATAVAADAPLIAIAAAVDLAAQADLAAIVRRADLEPGEIVRVATVLLASLAVAMITRHVLLLTKVRSFLPG
jgi:hypothetical protein